METPQIIAIVLLGAFGLFVGRMIARNAEKREKLPTDALSRTGHYLSSALMISVAPTVLTLLIVFHTGIVNAFLTAVVMLGLAFLFLIPSAMAEAAQPRQQIDRGWTAEDAKKSGL